MYKVAKQSFGMTPSTRIAASAASEACSVWASRYGLLHVPEPVRPMTHALAAEVICDRWVARFGLGFHPDTSGHEYVAADGSPCLSHDEAESYEDQINALFDWNLDPYACSLDAMRRAGLI